MLQIVVDGKIADKNRDSFVKALIRECKRQEVEHKIINSEKGFAINKPYVVTEPCDIDLVGIARKKYDCDCNATARVILNLLPDEPKSVLLIGRGKVVGRPLIDFITDMTNHNLMIVNSHTDSFNTWKRCNVADIIINTATSSIEYDDFLMGYKTLIDVNNLFKFMHEPEAHYNMSKIGKLTVENIVSNSKRIR